MIKQIFFERGLRRLLLCVLSVLCWQGYAAQYITNPDSHGIKFKFDQDPRTDKANITGWEVSENFDGILEIPASVKGTTLGYNITVDRITASEMTLEIRPNIGIKKITFASGSQAIMADNCFAGETLLEQVDLTNYAGSSIPKQCFKNAEVLMNVIYSPKITSIGEAAFAGGSSFGMIDLSTTNIESIGDKAFEGCRSLETLKLPATLKTLGVLSFSGCPVLESVDFSQTQLTTIPSQCFRYCYKISEVKFNEKITSIEGSAFNFCLELSSIEFPASLTNIGNTVFQDCWKLDVVRFKGTVPPTITNDAFSKTKAIPTFYVPTDCGKKYRAAMNVGAKAKVGQSTTILASACVREELKMSKYGFISYYLDTESFVVPSGATAYVITGQTRKNGERYAVKTVYSANEAVPAKTGFVLQATANATIAYEVDTLESAVKPIGGTSLMKGTATDNTFSGEEGKYFVLSPNTDGSTGVGFYFQKGTNGAKMTLKPHQAGLFIPKGMEASAKVFTFDENPATGIKEIEQPTTNNADDTVIYDLQGRRVVNPAKGIYIVNGKKVMFN